MECDCDDDRRQVGEGGGGCDSRREPLWLEGNNETTTTSRAPSRFGDLTRSVYRSCSVTVQISVILWLRGESYIGER
jgi:hypothetical protein